MFKKIISIAMALVIVIGGAISASAVCVSEEGRPGIVGMEYLDAILEFDKAWDEGKVTIPYNIEMVCVEGHWVAYLTGNDEYEGYEAVGFYDHCPTEEDFNILWANRLTEDELMDLMDNAGF